MGNTVPALAQGNNKIISFLKDVTVELFGGHPR